jgi:hypothetical protein
MGGEVPNFTRRADAQLVCTIGYGILLWGKYDMFVSSRQHTLSNVKVLAGVYTLNAFAKF